MIYDCSTGFACIYLSRLYMTNSFHYVPLIQSYVTFSTILNLQINFYGNCNRVCWLVCNHEIQCHLPLKNPAWKLYPFASDLQDFDNTDWKLTNRITGLSKALLAKILKLLWIFSWRLLFFLSQSVFRPCLSLQFHQNPEASYKISSGNRNFSCSSSGLRAYLFGSPA